MRIEGSRFILVGLALQLAFAPGCTKLPPASFRAAAELGPQEALSLSSSEPPKPGIAGDELRLASFNVQLPQTRAEIEALAAFMRSKPELRAVDVWLLQELETIGSERLDAAAWLAAELGMGHVYAPARLAGGGNTHGLAILSRLPLRAPERDVLPFVPLMWSWRNRISLSVSLDLGGRPLRVFNVHLDTRLTPAERRRQLAPVLEAAAAYERAVIAGDLNTNCCWFALDALPIPGARQARRFDRIARESGYATPFAAAGPTAKFGQRLDAVYARGVTARNARVVAAGELSDHDLLMLDLSLSANP